MKVRMDKETYIRRYSAEEAINLALPIYQACMVQSDEENAFLDGAGVHLFKKVHWKGLMLHGDHFTCQQPGPPNVVPEWWTDSKSSDEAWDVFSPTWIAMVERGIHEIYHVPIMEPGSLESYMEIGVVGSLPTTGSLALTMREMPEIGRYEQGLSVAAGGEWAAWSDADTVSVCGGEPALIDRIVQLSGGQEYLYDRAVDWAHYMFDVRQMKSDYVASFFLTVGWPVPDFLLR